MDPVSGATTRERGQPSADAEATPQLSPPASSCMFEPAGTPIDGMQILIGASESPPDQAPSIRIDFPPTASKAGIPPVVPLDQVGKLYASGPGIAQTNREEGIPPDLPLDQAGELYASGFGLAHTSRKEGIPTVLPHGQVGELYISGVGLAHSYLRDEALTLRRFPCLSLTAKHLGQSLCGWSRRGGQEWSKVAAKGVWAKGRTEGRSGGGDGLAPSHLPPHALPPVPAEVHVPVPVEVHVPVPADVHVPVPAEVYVPVPVEVRFFRTGDLGFINPQGQLVVTGRADHQVKVRGSRVDMIQVEQTVLAHPAVREAAVRVWQTGGQLPADNAHLVAYVALSQELVATDSAHQAKTDSVDQDATGFAHLVATDYAHPAVTDSAHLVATYSVDQVATDSVNQAVTDSAHLVATDSVNQAVTDSALLAVTNSAHLVATDSAHQAVTDSAHQVATDSIDQVATDYFHQTATPSRPTEANLEIGNMDHHPLDPPLSCELRTWMATNLPAAAVPSIYVRMSSLPRNPAGKVLRSLLPFPHWLRQQPHSDKGPMELTKATKGGHPARQMAATCERLSNSLTDVPTHTRPIEDDPAPWSAIAPPSPHSTAIAHGEVAVLSVFSSALGRRDLEPTDDFFRAGASSLTAAHAAALLGVDIRFIYAASTARRLSALLCSKQRVALGPALGEGGLGPALGAGWDAEDGAGIESMDFGGGERVIGGTGRGVGGGGRGLGGRESGSGGRDRVIWGQGDGVGGSGGGFRSTAGHIGNKDGGIGITDGGIGSGNGGATSREVGAGSRGNMASQRSGHFLTSDTLAGDNSMNTSGEGGASGWVDREKEQGSLKRRRVRQVVMPAFDLEVSGGGGGDRNGLPGVEGVTQMGGQQDGGGHQDGELMQEEGGQYEVGQEEEGGHFDVEQEKEEENKHPHPTALAREEGLLPLRCTSLHEAQSTQGLARREPKRSSACTPLWVHKMGRCVDFPPILITLLQCTSPQGQIQVIPCDRCLHFLSVLDGTSVAVLSVGGDIRAPPCIDSALLEKFGISIGDLGAGCSDGVQDCLVQKRAESRGDLGAGYSDGVQDCLVQQRAVSRGDFGAGCSDGVQDCLVQQRAVSSHAAGAGITGSCLHQKTHAVSSLLRSAVWVATHGREVVVASAAGHLIGRDITLDGLVAPHPTKFDGMTESTAPGMPQSSLAVWAHVDGTLVCAQSQDGSQIWSRTLNAQVFANLVTLLTPPSSRTLCHKLLVATQCGRLTCLLAANGNVLWTVTIGFGPISTAPAPHCMQQRSRADPSDPQGFHYHHHSTRAQHTHIVVASNKGFLTLLQVESTDQGEWSFKAPPALNVQGAERVLLRDSLAGAASRLEMNEGSRDSLAGAASRLEMDEVSRDSLAGAASRLKADDGSYASLVGTASKLELRHRPHDSLAGTASRLEASGGPHDSFPPTVLGSVQLPAEVLGSSGA
eukprot:gene10164-8068_t